MYIIYLIIFGLSLIHACTILYLFQIKEYRFDRFFSHVKDNGLIKTFYLISPRLPAKKIRNFGIIGIAIFFLLVFTTIPLSLHIIVGFLMIPITSFVAISIGVMITSIPVKMYRESLIFKAQQDVYKSKAVFIGITGSYGKSSVKEFLYGILSTKYKVGKTDKNMNSDVGIALSVIKNLKPDTQFFIAEFGSYKKGETKLALRVLQPTYGILTGLGNQHVDLYGSREALIEEESYLITTLPKEGKAYINYSIPDREKIEQTIGSDKIYYSLTENTQITIKELQHKNGIYEVMVDYNSQKVNITSGLLGKHNVLNVLPCIALALDIGMKPGEIEKAVKNLTPIEGKLSIHKGLNESAIINDSYNSNVEGFIAAIHVLNEFSQPVKIITSRAMMELGVEKRSSYEKIMNELAKTSIKLYTTDSLFKEFDQKDQVKTFNDVSDIQDELEKELTKDSVLLIEGKFTEEFNKNLIV